MTDDLTAPGRSASSPAPGRSASSSAPGRLANDDPRLRRYWHVACRSAELGDGPVAATVVGEELVVARLDDHDPLEDRGIGAERELDALGRLREGRVLRRGVKDELARIALRHRELVATLERGEIAAEEYEQIAEHAAERALRALRDLPLAGLGLVRETVGQDPIDRRVGRLELPAEAIGPDHPHLALRGDLRREERDRPLLHERALEARELRARLRDVGERVVERGRPREARRRRHGRGGHEEGPASHGGDHSESARPPWIDQAYPLRLGEGTFAWPDCAPDCTAFS